MKHFISAALLLSLTACGDIDEHTWDDESAAVESVETETAALRPVMNRCAIESSDMTACARYGVECGIDGGCMAAGGSSRYGSCDVLECNCGGGTVELQRTGGRYDLTCQAGLGGFEIDPGEFAGDGF